MFPYGDLNALLHNYTGAVHDEHYKGLFCKHMSFSFLCFCIFK